MFCPIIKKDCSRNCLWYKTDQRQYAGKADFVKVEGCVINLIYDELSNHSRQNHMQQKEMGEVKNIVLYDALAHVGVKDGEVLLGRKARKILELENAATSEDNKTSS